MKNPTFSFHWSNSLEVFLIQYKHQKKTISHVTRSEETEINGINFEMIGAICTSFEFVQ